MKLQVKLYRTVQIPTQELVWNMFKDEAKPVRREELDIFFGQKFSPVVKSIKFFWNFSHTKQLPEQMVVGIEVMSFDIRKAEINQQGLIETDFLDREEVLRREGALLSELERIGIFLMSAGNPFSWSVYYSTEGN